MRPGTKYERWCCSGRVAIACKQRTLSNSSRAETYFYCKSPSYFFPIFMFSFSFISSGIILPGSALPQRRNPSNSPKRTNNRCAHVILRTSSPSQYSIQAPISNPDSCWLAIADFQKRRPPAGAKQWQCSRRSPLNRPAVGAKSSPWRPLLSGLKHANKLVPSIFCASCAVRLRHANGLIEH